MHKNNINTCQILLDVLDHTSAYICIIIIVRKTQFEWIPKIKEWEW